MARPLDDDSATSPAQAPPKEGDVVGGRYRLTRKLGAGGMGDVFVAQNLAIDMLVAVKTLKPELAADATFRARFAVEARAIAAISHHAVARLYDLVVGEPTCLVMEYVAGEPLSEVLARGPMAPARASALATQLAWGLHAVHAAGVVHRDLKPSNVILTPDLERGELPKLIDFGVAKLARNPSLTRGNTVIGTPLYMAPEQVDGEADRRSDVYALACVLYEMLAGRPPFVDADDRRVLFLHKYEPPPLVTTHAPSVPEPLARLVQRALSKDPALRPQSMADFAEKLAAVTGGATRAATWIHEPPRERRHSLGAYAARSSAALLVAAALVAAGVIGARTLWPRSPAAAASTQLLLVSDPPGAAAFVDGKRAGVTPVAVPAAAGAHEVRFEKRGRQPLARTVEVGAEGSAVVDVSLPQSSRRVRLASLPPGASVFVDGRLVTGTTPTVVTLSDDDFHELRLEKIGYVSLVRYLRPEDRPTELTLPLEHDDQAHATVYVDANVAAEVWLDGVFTGLITPTTGFTVKPGAHEIELRGVAGDGHRRSQHIRARAGETLHLFI